MSKISMKLPNDISLYLFTIADIISVPPLLQFAEKATPIPPPQNEAPNTHAIKG